MASTVYYGVCTTAGNATTKQVKLIDSDFDFNNLRKGDILSVYFAHRNEATGIYLALYINDVNQEHNTGGTMGKEVYNTNHISVEPGAWTDGEVVNFSYTHNGTIVENPDNVYHWIMVGKPKATKFTYGDVILDGDDNSAASIKKVKDLLAKKSADSLSYSNQVTNGTPIGELHLNTYNTDGNTTTNSVTLTTFPLPTVPTKTSDLTNDSGFLTNPLQVTIDNQKKTIIDLHDSNQDTVINSIGGGILLKPASGQQVVIGSSSSSSGKRHLTVNGNITSLGGIITAPTIKTSSALETNTIRSYTSSGTITFDSPVNIASGSNTINNLHTNGITIGSQSLPNYIASQIGNTNVKNALKSWLASQLNDYLRVRRYHCGPFKTIELGKPFMIELGGGENHDYTYVNADGSESGTTKANLNIPGYDIVGIIAWETYGAENCQYGNICSIYWNNNDPSTGFLKLRLAAVTKSIPQGSVKVSADVLYKKKLNI